MCDSTSPERAPSAMRMPISRRCSVTACARTPYSPSAASQRGDSGEGAQHPRRLPRPEYALLLHLFHRHHVPQGQVGIDLPHRFPNRRHRRRRLAASANYQLDVLPRSLGQGYIGYQLWRRLQSGGTLAANHPHDLHVHRGLRDRAVARHSDANGSSQPDSQFRMSSTTDRATS